jgi:hypothetical protein
MRRLRVLSLVVSLLALITLGIALNAPAAAIGTAGGFWPRIIRVPPGGDLQAALNRAEPGDFIELPAGATFVGNFTLPNKQGKRWIVIYSSALLRLPAPGTRLSPAHAHLMPKIVTPNRDPAIRTAAGAHHYAFIGIEVTTTSPIHEGTVNLIDLEAQGQTTLERVPTDIIVYRCYIHGTPDGNIRRGIALNGARIAIVGSYFSDFHDRGSDSQAIMGWNGPGPFTIVGNYLEAAGVNLMFGGGDPTIDQLVPSDIVIRGNHFFKPLSWKVGHPSYAGTPWSVKSLFELKNARRVLVNGNVFENNWTGADQGGFAIVFTPRNQEGTAQWSTVQDVTFTHNVVRHSTAGINILGWDNLRPSQQLQRILVKNNLFHDIGEFPDTVFGFFTGMLFLVSDGPADLIIDHNTAFHTGNPIFASTFVGSRWPASGFVFTNNIILHNQGVSGAGTPQETLNLRFPGYLFTRNVLVGGDESQYPSGNFFPATLDEVGFVDRARGDYRLAAASPYRHAGTDGKDIGADIAALEAALLRWW